MTSQLEPGGDGGEPGGGQRRRVFLEALYRGGELLAAGQMTEARDHLERAYQMRPGNEKAQNLLGLAYFKLGVRACGRGLRGAGAREPGRPDAAGEPGARVPEDQPAARAVREFETAVDLQPGHHKAHNYLGLALAQAGEYGRAREHFVMAGSDAMAEKMAKALAAEARPAPLPPRPAPAPSPEAKVPGPHAGAAGGLRGPARGSARAASDAGGGRRARARRAAPHVRGAGAAGVDRIGLQIRRRGARRAAPGFPGEGEDRARRSGGERTLRDVARRTLADPAHPAVRPTELSTVAGKLPGDGSRTFIVTPEAVRVEVQGEVLVRTAGLLGWTGVIEARAEFKRFRGRVTDKPFGWGPARMHRLVGTGTAWLGVMGRTFLAIDLGDESVYLREDWVFGFEEPVTFENGRVPSEVAPDLDLVHLSGVGQVLLALPGPLRSTDVRHDAPVTVPLQHWVGWQGQLSPRVVALGWEGPEGTPAPAVELSGEGVALLCVPGSSV